MGDRLETTMAYHGKSSWMCDGGRPIGVDGRACSSVNGATAILHLLSAISRLAGKYKTNWQLFIVSSSLKPESASSRLMQKSGEAIHSCTRVVWSYGRVVHEPFAEYELQCKNPPKRRLIEWGEVCRADWRKADFFSHGETPG